MFLMQGRLPHPALTMHGTIFASAEMASAVGAPLISGSQLTARHDIESCTVHLVLTRSISSYEAQPTCAIIATSRGLR